MEGTIELKQYDGSQILPKDDAILYEMVTGGQCGIIKGCEITWLGSNQVHISAGYGIIRGRLFEVAEQTIYVKLPTSTDSMYGYLFVSVDLGRDTVIEIINSSFSTSVMIEGDWLQEKEINTINGVWEMPLVEYRASSSGVTEVTDITVKITAPYMAIKDFEELEVAVEEGYLVDANLVRKMSLTFQNKTVLMSSWGADETYEDYPYKASIYCTGVDSNYIPYVAFDVKEATAGMFAPVATTESNYVCIYANSIPDKDIKIPTIQCIRRVG